MPYVDALYSAKTNKIYIAERRDGERVLKEEPCEQVLYYDHPSGTHRTIFGDACKRFSTPNSQKFRKELGKLKERNTPVYESDINPVFRYLSENYLDQPAPELNVGFFDIETDFHPTRGFAPTDDTFNAITAITIYLSWIGRNITLALAPPTICHEAAKEIGEGFEDTLVFDNEKELLTTFLDVIDDVDVFSGWNSEGYDIPYVVNRIAVVLGKEATKKLCLWGQFPRERLYKKFGKEFKTYDLVGRTHLDYLILYQKHNTQQLHSYKLDFVGEIEVGEHKTQYDGTLDDLYKKDFRRFIEYNRQDVMLLVKIDKKRKFIELSNQLAHTNGVLLKTTVGSVALVEQAIINSMHAMGFVVPDRKAKAKPSFDELISGEDLISEKAPVVGAYVAKPKAGIQREVGCIDINSLYPSTIRAINMSPETIYGQLRPDLTTAFLEKRIAEGYDRAEAWEGVFNALEVDEVFNRSEVIIHVDFEDGTSREMTGAEIDDMIRDPVVQVCLSANGTIFKTDRDGIIPILLKEWYSERQSMQALEADMATLSADGYAIDNELALLLASDTNFELDGKMVSRQ